MRDFEFTYFHGPFEEYIVRDEVVADIAESGITLVPLNCGTEVNKKALPILRNYGLKAMVGDSRVYDMCRSRDIASVDGIVKQIVEDYKDFDNVVGYDLVDEPNASSFPILGAIVNAFRRYAPDKDTQINLFPNYASSEQLGNPDYMSHLEEYINVVKPSLISYDHYSFLGRDNRNAVNSADIPERERLIRLSAETTENRGGFFDNIEDVRAVALKYNIQPMVIVLLTEHGPYRNLSYGELLWEANMSLVYGMKRISYFTYWEPTHDEFWRWTNAMCDTEGRRMQHWYDVQSITRELTDVGRYLFDKTSTEVYRIGDGEEKTRAFRPYQTITAIDGDNGVIGFFDDGSVYLVNRDFILENTFTLHTEKPLTVRRNGVFVRLESNTITLKAGEGILLHI